MSLIDVDPLADDHARGVEHAVSVEGWVDDGFEPVRRAFVDNLTAGDERSAAVAIHAGGRLVADLRGWSTLAAAAPAHDSLYQVFSLTKAMTTGVLVRAVQDGVVDLDLPVARYWPEFAVSGKQAITVRELASHQAGLAAFDEPTSLADLLDWDLCVDRLARQAPSWTPARAHGYHTVTFGYLVGEVVRRAVGATVGTAFRAAIAEPLGLEAWIGLPEAERDRVLPMTEPDEPAPQRPLIPMSDAAGELLVRARHNPAVVTAEFNDPAMWSAEIPAVNGIASARSLAAYFDALVSPEHGMFRRDVLRDFAREHVNGHDLVLRDQRSRFGVGFMLSHPREPMYSAASFGHLGRGGSLGFADPDARIGYAYTTSYATADTVPDRRNVRIVTALRSCLDG